MGFWVCFCHRPHESLERFPSFIHCSIHPANHLIRPFVHPCGYFCVRFRSIGLNRPFSRIYQYVLRMKFADWNQPSGINPRTYFVHGFNVFPRLSEPTCSFWQWNQPSEINHLESIRILRTRYIGNNMFCRLNQAACHFTDEINHPKSTNVSWSCSTPGSQARRTARNHLKLVRARYHFPEGFWGIVCVFKALKAWHKRFIYIVLHPTAKETPFFFF